MQSFQDTAAQAHGFHKALLPADIRPFTHFGGDERSVVSRFQTIVEVLLFQGHFRPDDIAFRFLKNGDAETHHLTFGELASQARLVGTALWRQGGAEQRVLLLFPQSLDFIVAFFGTLVAGAVAVPAPHAQGSRASTARLQAVARDARPVMALTTPELQEQTTEALSGLTDPAGRNLVVTTIEALLAGTRLTDRDEDHAIPLPEASSLGLVQYTSGSTGDPRGVMISHANMIHNQELIRTQFEHQPGGVFVGWLPMFHDMGLIGNLLQPVYTGSSSVLLPPAAFLEDPVRWLRAITRYCGTTAGAPNFAYDFCVDRISMADRSDLDLRCWDIAFNGSEPVRSRTLDRFSSAFAPYGFRRSAFFPCYGMAEATLLIAGPRKSTPPVVHLMENPDGAPRQAVGCGATAEGHEILVVDPATSRPLPAGEVGEIWFAGPSVAEGYWQRPDETAETFGASPAGRDDPRWLRTGDLGFLAPAGREGDAPGKAELFVTGRIKDVIILRGRNHYPQDIEATAQASHPGLRPDCGAVFLIEEAATQTMRDRQAVILVQEVDHSILRAPPVADIAGAVRAAVSKEHGLHIAAVALLRPGSLPKTTSGKVQRRQSKARYIAGDLFILGEDRHGPAFWSPAESQTVAVTEPDLSRRA
jgi:acyl-CoA synthetase (AMP-forming)/AMP-acid ligase II